MSLPGRLDSAGRLVFAPNLGWGEPIDLRQPLEAAIGVPVLLENAANACALSELWFGGHPEHLRNLIAVTVSEGIGVGLLLNGQLLHGANGLAGEFGHVSIDDNGPACSCGKRGCWERFASNTAAIQDYAATAIRSRSKSAPPRFEDILRLAQSGDRHALDALERMAHFLGRGLGGARHRTCP